jgi:hypothetical protein
MFFKKYILWNSYFCTLRNYSAIIIGAIPTVFLNAMAIIDINLILGLLHHVAVGDVTDVPKACTIFIFHPEDGGSM